MRIDAHQLLSGLSVDAGDATLAVINDHELTRAERLMSSWISLDEVDRAAAELKVEALRPR